MKMMKMSKKKYNYTDNRVTRMSTGLAGAAMKIAGKATRQKK